MGNTRFRRVSVKWQQTHRGGRQRCKGTNWQDGIHTAEIQTKPCQPWSGGQKEGNFLDLHAAPARPRRLHGKPGNASPGATSTWSRIASPWHPHTATPTLAVYNTFNQMHRKSNPVYRQRYDIIHMLVRQTAATGEKLVHFSYSAGFAKPWRK